jgi:hypothetical protein
MATTHRLEISFDPLSDLTPTWTDLSSRLLEVPSVKVGVDDDLSEMQAGSATFRLDNRDRALEPGYAAGTYYPNVRPLRRIRYFIDDGVNPDWPIFYGYIVSWGPVWPGGMNQEAIIQAVDGSVILEMDTLPSLDPPTATSYEEVVMHDQPFAYYKLDESGGTKMFPVVGAEGVYKNMPAFQQASQIMGDPARSVEFRENVYGRAAVEDTTQFVDVGALTIEAWAQVTNSGSGSILQGPFDTAPTGDAIFKLSFGATDFGALVATTGSGTNNASVAATVTELHHVCATWDGSALRLYVDGVLGDTQPTSGSLVTPDASPTLAFGNRVPALGGTLERVTVSNVAVYEHALTPERVLAHYQAGAERGFVQQTAGERIAAAATTDLWAETDIDTGTHEVIPVMSKGQSRMEAIKDAVRAEFPSAMFYFPGTADPRYLGWDYGDTSPYNTVQATIGNNPGEVPFADIETSDDDEIYNEVTVAREGGLAQTAVDADSEAEFFRRTYELTGLIHVDDMGCQTVAAAILEDHSQPDPPVRVKSVTLTSDNALALAEILERQPGDLIRVKHRPKGGTAIDIITRIRGRTLTVAPLDGGNRVISATWTLGRGFNAAVAEWRLGIVGYTELNSTAVLG